MTTPFIIDDRELGSFKVNRRVFTDPEILRQERKPARTVSPDYKTQAGVLLSNQALRQSTRRDPTTLSDYLGTLSPRY